MGFQIRQARHLQARHLKNGQLVSAKSNLELRTPALLTATVRMACVAFVVVAMTGFLAERASARVAAIYTVPSVSPELAAAAEFKTRSDQNAYGSPDRTGIMRFNLPPQLTGLDAVFELTRQLDGSWAGQGTDGSVVEGMCGRESKQWFTCQVAFSGLKFDAIAREALVAAQFGRGFEFQQRTEVAQVFEGQPIGVISIRVDEDYSAPAGQAHERDEFERDEAYLEGNN